MISLDHYIWISLDRVGLVLWGNNGVLRCSVCVLAYSLPQRIILELMSISWPVGFCSAAGRPRTVA